MAPDPFKLGSSVQASERRPLKARQRLLTPAPLQEPKQRLLTPLSSGFRVAQVAIAAELFPRGILS